MVRVCPIKNSELVLLEPAGATIIIGGRICSPYRKLIWQGIKDHSISRMPKHGVGI
jgi:hypothetical protein